MFARWLCGVWLAGVLGQTQVWAQETNAEVGDKPKVVATEAEANAAPATPHQVDRGDTAWVLTSSALVLFMTAPGLAMFYGGLVRRKNVVSVLMQCIFLMALMTVLWATVGYTLAFGGDKADGAKPDPWIGNADYLCMDGVQAEWTGKTSFIPLHATLNIPR